VGRKKEERGRRNKRKWDELEGEERDGGGDGLLAAL
jgi:hypothetical protein